MSLKASNNAKFSFDFNALPPEITTLAESREGFSDLMTSSEIILLGDSGREDVEIFSFSERRSAFASAGGGGLGKLVFLIPRKI